LCPKNFAKVLTQRFMLFDIRRICLLTIMLTGLPVAFYAQQTKNNIVQKATISYTNRYNLPAVLKESSGLIWWNEKLWSHNDSGGTDSVYAFVSDSPMLYERYHVAVPNKDWEAVAQDEQFIYVGDFGNNKVVQRTDLRVYKIDKNSLLERVPIVDTIAFFYPEQTDLSNRKSTEYTDFDCEAFVAAGDSLYLFTKQWIGKQTAVYSIPKTQGQHEARQLASYNINGLVTDAEYLPEKRILALCGYSSTYLTQFIHVFYDFEEKNFFDGKIYEFTLNLGAFPHQVEGMTTLDGRIYYVTNEMSRASQQRLHRFVVEDFFEEYFMRPETALKINGSSVVCRDNRPVTYSISPVARAETYEWTLPEGVRGTSDTNQITVFFDTASVAGKVVVRAKNAHGYGGITTFDVGICERPKTPIVTQLSRNPRILQSSSSRGNQWYNRRGKIVGATSQQYEIMDYDGYYVIVTQYDCSSLPSNIVRIGPTIMLEELPALTVDSIMRPDADKLMKYMKEKKKRKWWQIFERK